jgi:hypothetical protein
MIGETITDPLMNTLPKSLTIAILAVSIFISGLSADLVSAQSSAPGPMVTLTPEEQAWLAEHPEIVLGASTDYPPMVIKRSEQRLRPASTDRQTAGCDLTPERQACGPVAQHSGMAKDAKRANSYFFKGRKPAPLVIAGGLASELTIATKSKRR